ncbi:ATP-binding cassette domain-containing protein [Solirubrobacter ginsenosidimutans]|uniref:ATP-binding cassette domain-containing protein n=1 Tax=Solirubrobacter ginsenosidimutans TaxID=490573 RepID=A0A9X3MUN2_9ACTN|nr:ATP-binding cassette domain-containing protein [Solirubrobacter ginsenosidimutans]MDA0162251.1 ATP-binding cassette domain-containing protein [Solirubrobacter ginsenosidimutans]
MASRPVLTASGLAVGRGTTTVASDISLELHRGELVAVLGPNGAGKSTLLATLAGLLPPLAGRVEIDGRVAAALQAPALARRSVRANLDAALSWWGVPKPDRPARALDALERMGVGELAERPAWTLSGGEARRVHLARAIALRPDVLLLDEPFAGVDVPTRAALLRDAASVLRDPSRATFVVLHDRAEAWALADRLIVLLDGRLAAAGEPRAVLERPPTRAVATFLGFTGAVRENGGGVRCVRPAQVALDADGPLAGIVARRIPEEDGVLCEVTLDGGAVQVRHPYPGPAEGEAVRLRLDGGVVF